MNPSHLTCIYATTIEIKQNLTLINRAVHNLEPRFTARVLRTLTGLRKKLYREAIQEVVNDVYPKSQSSPPLQIAIGISICTDLKCSHSLAPRNRFEIACSASPSHLPSPYRIFQARRFFILHHQRYSGYGD